MDKAGFMEATGHQGGAADCIEDRAPHTYHPIYNQEDVLFAREVLKKIISFGQDLHELSFYVDLGRQIVDCEMNLRRSAVKNRSAQENIRITAEISKMADMLRGYILRRLFQRKVQAAIQKSLSDS